MHEHRSNGHVSPTLFRERPEPLRPMGLFEALRVPEPKETLSELVNEFELRAAGTLPDVELPMSELAITDAGSLSIPNQGSFAVRPLSKKKLASRLGVRWNRWFDLAVRERLGPVGHHPWTAHGPGMPDNNARRAMRGTSSSRDAARKR
jgi:hypothetical protein